MVPRCVMLQSVWQLQNRHLSYYIISEDRENEGHEEFFEKKLPSHFLNQLLLVFTATFNEKHQKARKSKMIR